jgi:phosphate transport system substrate-binding protein
MAALDLAGGFVSARGGACRTGRSKQLRDRKSLTPHCSIPGSKTARHGPQVRDAGRFGPTRRHFVQLIRTLAAGALAATAAVTAAHALDISGAGATFPYPIYAKWADAYKKETGNGLNYQSIGSGGGIKQIKAKTVTFGASDMPLEPKELAASGLVQFPTVIGGDVPVVNIDGIKSSDLKLDGETLARIFLGEIAKWDDPAIKKLNPSAKLPSQAIAVVHRSDGSGTTFIFTD